MWIQIYDQIPLFFSCWCGNDNDGDHHIVGDNKQSKVGGVNTKWAFFCWGWVRQIKRSFCATVCGRMKSPTATDGQRSWENTSVFNTTCHHKVVCPFQSKIGIESWKIYSCRVYAIRQENQILLWIMWKFYQIWHLWGKTIKIEAKRTGCHIGLLRIKWLGVSLDKNV